MSIEEQWKEEAQISLEKVENAIDVEIAHDFILGYVEGRKAGQLQIDNAHEMFKAVTMKNSKSLSGQLVEILSRVENLKSQSRDNEALVRLICSVASDTITDVESLSMETIPEIVGRLKEIINLTLKYK